MALILFNYSALQYTILLKFNFTSFCVTLVNFSGSYTLTLIGYFSSNYAAKHSLQPRKSFSNLLHTVYILLVYYICSKLKKWKKFVHDIQRTEKNYGRDLVVSMFRHFFFQHFGFITISHSFLPPVQTTVKKLFPKYCSTTIFLP